MDALSDVLRTVRLDGAVYLKGEMTAPWCVEGPANDLLCAAFLPLARHVVAYHLLTEGACWARISGSDDPPLEIRAGEILVVPRGEPHIMASSSEAARARPDVLGQESMSMAAGDIIRLTHGGGGAMTSIVCGFLACDDVNVNPLLSSLPRLFKVDMRNGGATAAWLETSMRFAVEEAAGPRAGSAMVLSKLSELLFVEALRRCIETLPEGEKNWLAGLRDRFVGKALTLLHAQPARAWTVDELAREVGLSRSALAQRFTEFLGQPPMQYLARWRLQIAAQSLKHDDEPIAVVAERVGYDSEAAFNRAFKREFGAPPASWRRTAYEQRNGKPGSLAATA
ncbi:MAG TPA: AraC family transcriptional regulator [Hyphomicrobiaceae bacterium]|nr:AraC family transcriptional regulator [Hyphomicrobiaceae bacterium]